MISTKMRKVLNRMALLVLTLTLVSGDIIPLVSYAKEPEEKIPNTGLVTTDSEYKKEDEQDIHIPEKVDTDKESEQSSESAKGNVIESSTEETVPGDSIESIMEDEDTLEVNDTKIDTEGNKEESIDDTKEGTNAKSSVRNVESDSKIEVQATTKYVLAKDTDFSGTGNGNFRYIGKDDYVEIPHTIKGIKITSYASMFNEANVKGVKSTNKNVTAMDSMFSNFKGETLDVSELDTSSVRSMAYMFHATSVTLNSLTKLIGLDKWDTSNVVGMRQMFYRSSIGDINVTNFNTSNVKDMISMFEDTATYKLDVSSFDTTKVTSMDSMFGATRAEVLDLSNFNTANVTNMDYMFNTARATTIKGLENFNTGKVTSMVYMFRGTLAKELDLSNFNTANVTSMNRMFHGAEASKLDLRSFDTRKVTNMVNMFTSTKASSIDVSSFDTSNVTSMNSMFMDSRATELDLSSFDTSNVTDMIYMFRGANATKLNISSFNTSRVTKMTQMFNNSNAEQLDFSGFNTQNVVDMGQMFYNSGAKELDLHTFSTKRLTDMHEMFRGTSATKIDLSSFDTKYVTNMNSMFKDSNVQEIDLSSFNMESVNDTDNMFQNTKATRGIARSRVDESKLTKSLNKPSSLTFTSKYELATDEDFSGFYNGNFRYIGKKEYIEMPDNIKGTNMTSYKSLFENTSVKGVISTNKNITDMSSMFKGNTSEELDVGSIDTTKVTDMSGMFQNTNSKTFYLEGFNTGNVTNMSNLFNNTKITELDLGSFDLTKVTNTENMFNNTLATIGYARTNEDLVKLNNSTNKPLALSFTIWGVRTKQNTDEWTNEPVVVDVNAESTKNGISFVEMVNETGRNYLIGSKDFSDVNTNNNVTYPMTKGYDAEVGANYIYGRYKPTEEYALTTYASRTYDIYRGTTYSEELYPLPDKITYSIALMSEQPIEVGFNGFYTGGENIKLEPNKWTRLAVTIDSPNQVRPASLSVPRSSNIPLGTKLYYKEFKIEKGDTATPWKPAPEDSATSGGQKDAFTLYTNGTYIFRATDTLGNTKTVSHKVTNIDTTQPSATLTSSPEGWTSTDVKIYVNAEDDLSGVDFITLPDGKKVSSNTVEYPVTSNGKYTFKVTDKAGNETSYTKEITNIDKSIPSLTAKTLNKQWTSGTVDIEVTSGETASGLTGIEMINSPLEGRNLTLDSDKYLTNENNTTGILGFKHAFQNNLDSIRGKQVTVSLDVDIENYKSGRIGYEPSFNRTGDTTQYIGTWYGRNRNEVWFGHGEDGQSKFIGRIETEKQTIDSGVTRLSQSSIYNQLNADAIFKVGRPKFEIGTKSTPWTPAPEDIKLLNNKKVYPVASNGLYTFKATYNNGATSEASVNIANIDRTAPVIKLLGNVEDWTEEDSLVLTLNATDTQSGVKSITLPDKKVVNGDTTTYKVTKNGQYKFTVTDNVGNQTTHIETVKYLMIPYSFYIYDKDGKPVQGAEFELLRGGEYYKTAVSTLEGLVDFGKVPPEGSYQIRQVTAPGGVVIDPEDIESGDFTEPVEVVKYPRGDTLPATGTTGLMIIYGLTLGIVGSIRVIQIKRKKRKQAR